MLRSDRREKNMDLQLIRENMEVEQVLSARPAQVTVETEAALPGGLREEARVYYADAWAVVHGGEAAGSRVSADGRVTFHVLYAQGDLSKIEVLETGADFAQSLALQGEETIAAAVRLQPRAEVQHVSAKAFNGRLLLRAVLLLTAEAALPRAVAVVTDVDEADPVERDRQTLRIQRVVGEGEGQTLLREEFELSDVLQIKNTLFATAQAQVEDILGGADGRATLVGTVALEAYHTSDMPEHPLVYTRHTMPFEQQVGLSGALGDALSARAAVRDVAVLSQEGEKGEKILRAEVQLASGITAVENAEKTVLRDLFSTRDVQLTVQCQPVVFRSGAVNEQAAASGKTVLTLGEGMPRAKTALLGFARPVLVKAERAKEGLTCEGVLTATLIYRAEDSETPQTVTQEQPFRAVFATEALPEDHLSLTACQVEPSAITGDRVEIKYTLVLSAEGVRKSAAQVIADVEEGESELAEKGIVLCFMQPGEGIWDLAKRYRTPLSDLRRMNPGLTDHPAPGTPVIAFKR